MRSERTSFAERTRWPGFATATLSAVVVLSCYPILAGWDVDLPFAVRLSIVVAIVGFVAALYVVIGGLTVRVQESRILVHLGSVPLIKKVVPFVDVVGLRAVTYRPIREFGGWGVRGMGRRRAWTARGNRAVELRLTGDRELLIGSDYPQRLEERIRTGAGDRLATDADERASS